MPPACSQMTPIFLMQWLVSGYKLGFRRLVGGNIWLKIHFGFTNGVLCLDYVHFVISFISFISSFRFDESSMSRELAILPLRALQRDSDEPFYYLIESYGNCAKKKYDISFKIWIWIYDAHFFIFKIIYIRYRFSANCLCSYQNNSSPIYTYNAGCVYLNTISS